MVRRLFSFAVVLAIAGAPVALAACDITCRSRSEQAAPAHHTGSHANHHEVSAPRVSCHEAPAVPFQLVPHGRPCDHDEDATTLSLVAARHSDGVWLFASPVPAFQAIASEGSAAAHSAKAPALTDPLELRLAGSLRI
jgi:hypothetical protein